jgi:hypothetical protein
MKNLQNEIMKLKFELFNGYGVLIDENPVLNKGNLYIDRDGKIKTVGKTEGGLIYSIEDMDEDEFNHHYFDRNCEIMGKIIFAEPELKLEGVPVFEWKDFEPNEKSLLSMFYNVCKATYPEFDEWIEAKEYKKWLNKSNQAKYTEDDLRKITQAAFVVMSNPETVIADFDRWFEKRLQSLQKYPKWVVMESEYFKVNGMIDEASSIRSKLYTNSDGKQQGIVKELIWT